MSNAKITLYSFYRWFKIVNLDLFSEMVLPDAINREQLINTILLRGGEFEVQFDSADMVKFQIGVVSKNWYDTFKRWAEALAKEYEPLDNYDRKEEWTDDTHGTSSSNANGGSTHNATNTRSAFNSNSLMNDSGEGSSDTSSSNASGSADNHATHSGRVHGNIGVTTSDQLLTSYMKTREVWGNLYNHVADVILRELVIPIY